MVFFKSKVGVHNVIYNLIANKHVQKRRNVAVPKAPVRICFVESESHRCRAKNERQASAGLGQLRSTRTFFDSQH